MKINACPFEVDIKLENNEYGNIQSFTLSEHSVLGSRFRRTDKSYP